MLFEELTQMSTEQVLRHLQASTTGGVPPLEKTDPGLFTKEEYLKILNPHGKSHDSKIWDNSLKKMNQDFHRRVLSRYQISPQSSVSILKATGGYFIKINDKLVAVLLEGTMYYSPGVRKENLPTVWYEGKNEHPLPIRGFKQVKYIKPYLAQISNVAQKNWKTYPYRVQHLRVGNEALHIRSEKPLQKDKGINLAILNPLGQIVAVAQNEWGATLLIVAREYRSKGLGTILGKIWSQWNPKFTSGGFTTHGESAAIRLWEVRVREFLSRGWYSELIRSGRLRKNQVEEILKGLGQRSLGKIKTPNSKPEILFYIDYPTFVIYDRRFLDNPEGKDSEKYIYGYGFFRSSRNVGTFLFSIDYDPKFRKLAHYVSLQMARDHREKLYNGEGYHDVMELEGISNVEREGDYVFLSRNVMDLKSLGSKEKRIRAPQDPYQEKQTLLLEAAEAKW